MSISYTNDESSAPRHLGVRSAAGFSVLETMVSTALFGVVLAGLCSSLFEVHASNAALASKQALRQQSRVALHRVETDLQLAGLGSAGVAEPVIQAAADQIVFTGDIDFGSDAAPCINESANAAPGVERVTFRMTGTVMERAIECWTGAAWISDGDAVPLASDVDTARSGFRYFDETGTELAPGASGLDAAQLARLVRVRIAIGLTDNGASQARGQEHPSVDMTTDVYLRNGHVS